MGTQVWLEIDGRDFNDDDIHRAETAALKVLEDAGVAPEVAYAEFQRQWAYLETDEAIDAGLCQDHQHMTGLAATWIKAERAADIALTEGWHDPDGAWCFLRA